MSSLARDYERGYCISQHMHNADQLLYASRGVMEVMSNSRVWIIPPHFGLWIPNQTPHEINMLDHVSMRTLYLRPGIVNLGVTCRAIHVRPLLRELVFEIVRHKEIHEDVRLDAALSDVFVAELLASRSIPTEIKIPNDRRTAGIARKVIENPGLKASLASLCAEDGVNVRTFERAFRNEVGVSFEVWRRQVRLMKAIEFLVGGRSIKEAAYLVGYQQPTAFVALFRATFGTTPKAWIAQLLQLE